MNRRDRVWVWGALLAFVVGAAGCVGEVPAPQSTGSGEEDECALDGGDAENERSPGYPYDFELFKSDIAPLLVADCAACHTEALDAGGFIVFANAAEDDCARVKTFKQFRNKVDLSAPASSRMIFALEGGALTNDIPHPLDYESSADGQAKLDKINAFITQASATCAEGGGCSAEVRDFFDYAAFQSDIQPGLNEAGCSASAACHAPPGQANLGLPPSPAADSAEMEASYDAVKSRISLDADPSATLFYVKATTRHAPGGASTQIDEATADALVEWIEAAVAARGDGGDLGCADPAKLDLGVFRDEILPILSGELDLNGGEGIATGCTRGPCHGQERPGSLSIIPSDPIEEQLANFACFVNLTSPVSSQVLLCPRNDPSCIKSPHPGAQLLLGADDLNYQRILSFLFSSSADITPLDFAFFARRINPTFDNRNAVVGSQTCANNQSCHGIAIVGGEPPNGANLSIIPDAGEDVALLTANFIEASAFINFISPDQSSLFLYPTNEIANLENPVATGFPHPGGEDFAVDSQFARDILTFARGLRPDAQGFQRNWLVAGHFQTAGGLSQATAVDEEAVQPVIFDRSGGSGRQGLWDGLFSEERAVDVGTFLGGAVGNGRIAFAAAYLFNTTNRDLDVEVELSASSDARLYLGDAIAQVAPGGSIRVPITIPSIRAESGERTGTRVLIKLFQAPEQDAMNFRVRLFRGDSDRVFDEESPDVIVKLGPRGGV
jgi:hypothetical protein